MTSLKDVILQDLEENGIITAPYLQRKYRLSYHEATHTLEYLDTHYELVSFRNDKRKIVRLQMPKDDTTQMCL